MDYDRRETMNRCLLLFGLGILVCGRTAQAAPAQAAPPIIATVSGTGLPGLPLQLKFSLSSAASREFYADISSHPNIWEFKVDWLGGSGLGRPTPVRSFGDAGVSLQTEGEVLPFFGRGMNINSAIVPIAGTTPAVQSININDFFDMSQHGVYAVRAGRTIYFDAQRMVHKTYWSAPVIVVVW